MSETFFLSIMVKREKNCDANRSVSCLFELSVQIETDMEISSFPYSHNLRRLPCSYELRTFNAILTIMQTQIHPQWFD